MANKVKLLSVLEPKKKNVSKKRDAFQPTSITDLIRTNIQNNSQTDNLQYKNAHDLGVVLRVEPDSVGPLGTFTRNLFDTLGFDAPYKKRLRVYSPYYHGAFEMPEPNGDLSGSNAALMQMIPDRICVFEAEDDLANNADYKPGDIVKITFKNFFPLIGPVLVGPYSRAVYNFNGATTSFIGLFNSSTAQLEELQAGEATSLKENCTDAEPGFEDFRQPATGRVSSTFGPRSYPVEGQNKGQQRMHSGIDISQGQGLDVVVSANGTVVYCQADGGPQIGPVVPSQTSMCYLYIKHFIDTKWYVTGYYHMSEISVKQGDSVEAGNVIGKSGGALGSPGSGGTTGPHLHYEFATCTKDPSVGTDPRYSNCGFKAIDCGTYTGWLTAVDEQYKRNISCKNQYDSLVSDAEESFEDSYTTNLDDTFETEESLETLEEESEE